MRENNPKQSTRKEQTKRYIKMLFFRMEFSESYPTSHQMLDSCTPGMGYFTELATTLAQL